LNRFPSYHHSRIIFNHVNLKVWKKNENAMTVNVDIVTKYAQILLW
jgi:hypothetical protein